MYIAKKGAKQKEKTVEVLDIYQLYGEQNLDSRISAKCERVMQKEDGIT